MLEQNFDVMVSKIFVAGIYIKGHLHRNRTL